MKLQKITIFSTFLLGYKNVTIFEKEGRVGGKAHTVEINGNKYDTGTVASYRDPMVMKLFEETGLIGTLEFHTNGGILLF